MEELLKKYFTSDISRNEKKLLFEALNSDQKLREEFYALQNTIALSRTADGKKDAMIGEKKYKEFISYHFRYRLKKLAQKALAYGAVAGLVAVCVYLYTSHTIVKDMSQQYTEISAPRGQRVNVMLPDGTSAWLSPCSTIRYASSFNKKDRHVEIIGASYFEVSRNENMPFRISAGDYQVEVLGTTFNVRAYPESDRFEVDLIEGCVKVNNVNDETDQLVLNPHEQAVLKNNRLTKVYSYKKDREFFYSGIVQLDNIPLGDILDDVAEWNDVEIDIQPSVDRDFLVTGKIRQSDSLESILKALKEIAHFNFTIDDGSHVTIYQK